ncbi:glutamate synthase (NADPH/NADH) [Paragonimus westermani]|uniref:Glutamate synthase (NADPH/NADH) n=1 Tax=Paragonimus westermani TaxID=34504 RepID=A0A5J4NCU1_9TREM|nr:glutamate synthase (NADPH/NADH) [Paragonimus westermani]
MTEDGVPELDISLSPVDALLQCLPSSRRLDCTLLQQAKHLIETPKNTELQGPAVVSFAGHITNEDRTAFTSLSYAISAQFADEGLPSGREIKINLSGSAGQSFCAFLVQGISVRLEGDANDYVAKGLSGGHVTIVPPRGLIDQGFQSETNLLVGNVCLYGATSGRLFLRGQAAERFCVRNSGATVVVEGVGDHGCEYMTGGRAVILGRTGRNFAAGMSGGLAFVYDPAGPQGPFARKCNMEMVDLETITAENPYTQWLESIVHEFTEETRSKVGERILSTWSESLRHFILVFPRDYRLALGKKRLELPLVTDKENVSPKSMSTALDIEDLVYDDVTHKLSNESPLDKLRGFVKYSRAKVSYRPVSERVDDWEEVYAHAEVRKSLRRQAARCMDCGVPFCQSHTGCPLGNLIPNWNDLVFKDDWFSAFQALDQTNNFPEFTGRVCPAPCEGACVLGINADPVTIKHIECTIADKAWEMGWFRPMVDVHRPPTGHRIVIVGSGPSGLACADQLSKAGHSVTVLERRNKPGGLLRYGIPTMKLDRKLLDQRLDLMRSNGVQFVVNTRAGPSGESPGRRDLNANCAEVTYNGETMQQEWSAEKLLREFDVIVLCLGATWPRDLNIPGRHLDGIHFAMSFLERWQRKQQQCHHSQTSGHVFGAPLSQNLRDEDGIAALAKDRRVVVLGGGDTGVDCVATSLRQRAKSIVNLEILPPPPPTRNQDENPWPEFPRVWRVEYGHAEVAMRFGRDPRHFTILTKEFLDNGAGAVRGIRTVCVNWSKDSLTGTWKMQEVPDSEHIFECDLVLLALGFIGPENKLIEELALSVSNTPDAVITTKLAGSFATNVPRVYAAGDCRRGQSLVVHAINEGRQVAREVDLDLMGSTLLPGPGGVVRAYS